MYIGGIRKLGALLAFLAVSQCVRLALGTALTTLYARSFGASRPRLIDVESLAPQNTRAFAQAEQMLSELNPPVAGVGKASQISPALERLSAVCLTNGLASLQAIQHILPYYEISAFLLAIEYPKCSFKDYAQVAREARTL
jgi:hypothetical protein